MRQSTLLRTSLMLMCAPQWRMNLIFYCCWTRRDCNKVGCWSIVAKERQCYEREMMKLNMRIGCGGYIRWTLLSVLSLYVHWARQSWGIYFALFWARIAPSDCHLYHWHSCCNNSSGGGGQKYSHTSLTAPSTIHPYICHPRVAPSVSLIFGQRHTNIGIKNWRISHHCHLFWRHIIRCGAYSLSPSVAITIRRCMGSGTPLQVSD